MINRAVTGVARVTKCGFKEYTVGVYRGEYGYYAEATVLEPAELAGEVTAVSVPLITADQVSRVLNELRKLMGPEYLREATPDNLEDLVRRIELVQPLTRFRTFQGKGNYSSHIYHVWEGGVAYEEVRPGHVV